MTLSDKFIGYWDTFYSKVNTIVPLNYPDLVQLSHDLFYQYGEREMYGIYASLPPDDIISYIAKKFVSKWNKIISTLDSEFSAGTKTVENWTGADITKYEKGSTNTVLSQTSTYSDPDFVDSDKRIDSWNGMDTESKTLGTGKTTVTTDGKSPSQNAKYINYLQKNDICAIINKDVIYLITTLIRRSQE